jgi:hypothetical protein
MQTMPGKIAQHRIKKREAEGYIRLRIVLLDEGAKNRG